jgi:A/G-specific adenine glycosylase
VTHLTPEFFAQTNQIRFRLLEWYRQHRRDLPWRNESAPYRIWISEVMLQQTQVATVIPYYQRFLEKFATIEVLAAAPLAEVLKVWQGLGYYARARHLHQAALEIVTKWDGQFPKSYAALRQLPGFGDYTAGAVASIAFGEVTPAVDGNVKRVLARLFALETNLKSGPAARQLRELAAALVDPLNPGDWNQAVMELGATTCLPQTPRCHLCPLSEMCQARQRGLERQLPLKPLRKTLPHYHVAAAVIIEADKILIAQRPLKGMLGGLWEFPGGKQEPGETLAECLRREINEELGIDIAVEELLISVKHSYTHFKITLHAFYSRWVSGQPQVLGVADWRWVTLAEMDTYAFPRTDLKIIEALKKERQE